MNSIALLWICWSVTRNNFTQHAALWDLERDGHWQAGTRKGNRAQAQKAPVAPAKSQPGRSPRSNQPTHPTLKSCHASHTKISARVPRAFDPARLICISVPVRLCARVCSCVCVPMCLRACVPARLLAHVCMGSFPSFFFKPSDTQLANMLNEAQGPCISRMQSQNTALHITMQGAYLIHSVTLWIGFSY